MNEKHEDGLDYNLECLEKGKDIYQAYWRLSKLNEGREIACREIFKKAVLNRYNKEYRFERSQAIEALHKLKPENASLAADVMHVLFSDPGFIHKELLSLLSDMAPHVSTEVAVRYVDQINNPDPLLRASTATLLGACGPGIMEVIPDTPLRLGELVRDEDDTVRLHAVWALLQLGPHAVPAIPFLIEAKRDRKEKIATKAALSIAVARGRIPAPPPQHLKFNDF